MVMSRDIVDRIAPDTEGLSQEELQDLLSRNILEEGARYNIGGRVYEYDPQRGLVLVPTPGPDEMDQATGLADIKAERKAESLQDIRNRAVRAQRPKSTTPGPGEIADLNDYERWLQSLGRDTQGLTHEELAPELVPGYPGPESSGPKPGTGYENWLKQFNNEDPRIWDTYRLEELHPGETGFVPYDWGNISLPQVGDVDSVPELDPGEPGPQTSGPKPGTWSSRTPSPDEFDLDPRLMDIEREWQLFQSRDPSNYQKLWEQEIDTGTFGEFLPDLARSVLRAQGPGVGVDYTLFTAPGALGGFEPPQGSDAIAYQDWITGQIPWRYGSGGYEVSPYGSLPSIPYASTNVPYRQAQLSPEQFHSRIQQMNIPGREGIDEWMADPQVSEYISNMPSSQVASIINRAMTYGRNPLVADAWTKSFMNRTLPQWMKANPLQLGSEYMLSDFLGPGSRYQQPNAFDSFTT
jgi:hypothetical protein